MKKFSDIEEKTCQVKRVEICETTVIIVDKIFVNVSQS